MLKKTAMIVLSIFSIFFTQCGLFQPDTHEVTVDNHRNDNILVTFIDDDVPIGSLPVKAHSKETKEMEGSGSYTILIAYGYSTWSTSNSKKDIMIVVPSSGKPYKK